MINQASNVKYQASNITNLVNGTLLAFASASLAFAD
jgi:hypothetical protein